MDDALQDPALWVGIRSRGMPFISEYELADRLVTTTNTYHKDKSAGID